MLKQIITFSFRSLRKLAFMNLLNLGGLMLGLSVFFMTTLFLYQENSYEKDFDNRNQIYQISTNLMGTKFAMGPINLPLVLNEIPEIELFTSFKHASKVNLFSEGKELKMRELLKVDSGFFEVFNYELLFGDVASVLNDPNTIVLNENAAQDLFGTLDVVGKIIKIRDQNGKELSSSVVGGVSKQPQFKSQISFDLVLSKNVVAKTEEELKLDNWQSASHYLFAVLNKNSSEKVVNQKLDELAYKYIYPKTYLGGGKHSLEEWKELPLNMGFYVESIETLRKTSETKMNLMPKMNKGQVETLEVIGLISLLISIINFINISTAKASVRMKEVGVKKVLGASKSQLIGQFLFESFVLVLISSILALGIVESVVILKPSFIGIQLDYSVLHSSEWVLRLISIIFVITLTSGLYPALYLSSGKALSIIKKGAIKNNFSILNAALFRKGATVVQFVCSIGLIIGVLVMFTQIDFLKKRNIGYDANGVVVISNTISLSNSQQAFKTELLKLSSISSAAYSNRVPNAESYVMPFLMKVNDSTELNISPFSVDSSFFEVMGMKFIHGNAFEKRLYFDDNQDDSEGKKDEMILGKQLYPAVLNEVAARALNLENPIGSIVQNLIIVGVVDDFVFSDLRQKVEPVILTPRTTKRIVNHPLVIKANSNNQIIKSIQKLWSKFTNETMEWNYLESNYSKLITKELEGFNAVLFFSILAIIISLLGLLGLAIFTVDQRIHEFGIRKVLGASVSDIMRLFSWNFVKLIIVAFVISMPISFFVMNSWLSDFANRISISTSLFVIAGCLTLIIVFTTIFLQSLKAGRLNPVDTLRNE